MSRYGLYQITPSINLNGVYSIRGYFRSGLLYYYSGYDNVETIKLVDCQFSMSGQRRFTRTRASVAWQKSASKPVPFETK